MLDVIVLITCIVAVFIHFNTAFGPRLSTIEGINSISLQDLKYNGTPMNAGLAVHLAYMLMS